VNSLHASSGQDARFGDSVGKLLDRRVALTGGLVRALVASAENPEDTLRTACMLTLIEIGGVSRDCGNHVADVS